MNDYLCPSCGLPISEAAFASGICPCCEHSFLEPFSAPVVQLEPMVPVPLSIPQTPPTENKKRFLGVVVVWAVALVVGVGLGLGFWYFFDQPLEFVEVAQKEQTPPTTISPLPDTQPQTQPVTPEKEILPAPRVVEEQRPEPVAVAPKPMPLPPPKVEIIDPVETPEKKLNDPNGEAEVLSLNGMEQLVLTGKIKVLRIGPLNGKALLDATGLDVEEIVFTGALSGSSEVKVNAPNGKVRVTKQINGAAKLRIYAPDGEVTFAGEEEATLTEGSLVELTAKRVDIQSLMNGGTRVEVTLTTGGSLRTGVMDGGATVRYRAAVGNQSELKIETGELRGGASVKPAK